MPDLADAILFTFHHALALTVLWLAGACWLARKLFRNLE